MTEALQFGGRVAIVTGAGRGIGRLYAAALARRGCAVLVNDIDAAACNEVAESIGTLGGRASANSDSVATYAGAQAMVSQTIEKFGRLDILINNAGIIRDKTFHKLSVQDLDLIIDVHLRGTSYVTHAAWRHLRDQKYGRVVFTTSSAALWGNFGQSNYAAAKLGIVGLMQALKLEGTHCGVRVNTVAPLAMTRMGEAFFPKQLNDCLSGENVEALMTYLCSEACEVSGEIFEVGGGRIRVVRLLASAGLVFAPGFTPEDVQRQIGHLLRQSADSSFASVGQALDSFMQHVSRGSGRQKENP